MNRLLIVLTRIYARRGHQSAEGDEFVHSWGLDAGLEHKAFACESGGQMYRVLVLHGHEYPADLAAAAERAAAALGRALDEAGLLGDGLRGLKTGMLCHVRLAWTPEEKDSFLAMMREHLEESGADVAAVRRYSYDTNLPPTALLAPQCRQTSDGFADGFARTWNYYFVESKFGQSRHSVLNLFNALDEELQLWREDDFEDTDEYLTALVRTAPPSLAGARLIVMGDPGGGAAGDSLVSFADQIALDFPVLRDGIEREKRRVVDLFAGEDYERAVRTLEMLRSPEQRQPGEVLSALRAEMKGGRSFIEWYHDLSRALEALRQAMNVR